MKKLFLSVMAVAALMVTSCSTKTTDAEASDEGAAIKSKIENCTDPDSLAIYVQQAKDYADKLVKEGNDSAAQAYLEQVTPVVQQKDPTAATIFDQIQSKADSVVAEGIEKAEAAKDAVADKANDVKDAAADKANEAKDAAKAAADKAADKVGNAADNAKQKAADAVQNGADKLKGALGK